jgi:hypothetical protein
MSSRDVLITLFLLALFMWLGYPSFATCHANGGSIIACGLLGFFIGMFRAAIIGLIWLLATLFDGFSHLFGH